MNRVVWKRGGVVLCLFLLSAMSALFGELPDLIPIGILAGNPERVSPQISPDGAFLAYVAPIEGVQNVWIRDLKSGVERPLTRDGRKGVRKYVWAADGRRILYLQDNDGDENWRLFAVDMRAPEAEPKNLTPYDRIRVKIIATSPRVPEEVLITMNLERPKVHDLYRVHLGTGRPTLVAKNPGTWTDWVANDRLEAVAAMDFAANGSMKVMGRETPRSPWKTLLDAPADEPFQLSAVARDGRSLYLLAYLGNDQAGLWRLDLGSGELRTVFRHDRHDVTDVFCDQGTGLPMAVKTEHLREAWHLLSETVRPDFDAISAFRSDHFGIESRDRADRKWVVRFITPGGPWHYALYDRRTHRAERLFVHRPQLERLPLAGMEPVLIRARDGLGLVSYLTLPVGIEPKRLPLVVLVHGGPEARDSLGYSVVGQMCANRGYAVLQVNYRGSTGFGRSFLNASVREWGGKMLTDLVDAAAWAVERGIADPRKMAIVGSSFGGYQVLCAAAFAPEVFACGVDEFGISNLFTHIAAMDPQRTIFLELLRHRIGDGEKEPGFIRSISPFFHADRIRMPLLIAQGANDPRVKAGESRQIARVLWGKGKRVSYLEFPDEGHGFRKPANQLAFLAAMDRFLADHLGGRCEPIDPARQKILDRVARQPARPDDE